MSGLAVYALKGMLHAAMLAAAFLTLSLLFPPVAWLSGSIVALVTLRNGFRHGLLVIGTATAAAMVMFALTLGSWLIAPALELIFWLPVFLMALILRQYIRLEYSLIFAAGLGLLGLSLMYLILSDPPAAWLSLLREGMKAEIWAEQFRVSQEEFDQFLQEVAQLMPGSTIASLVFSAIISLLLARSWQAKLFNPGGFQTEFHQLRYGRAVASVALLIIGIGLVLTNSYTIGLITIVLAVYLFQGLAIVHALIKLKKLGTGWLVAVYALSAILPQMLVILGGVGLIDTWLDSRRRLAAKAE